MIKKLQFKFVFIAMTFVSLILLAIFFTMIVSNQKNNERMNIAMLHQALNMRQFPPGNGNRENRPPPPSSGENAPNMRLPILVIEIDTDENIQVLSNQLYFIEEDDMVPIVKRTLDEVTDRGILQNYALRYLQRKHENNTRIAFADISIEQEILKTQIANSLLIGVIATLVFFLMSLFLSCWAVRPVEIAWERQKQFIANASHELKTPLTVILSNAEMLQNNTHLFDEQNSRRIEHIHAETIRMKQLVEDMLALAKSDNTENSKIQNVVNFSYIVKSSTLMYEPIAYDEGKNFAYEITDNFSITGNATQLQQLTHILLDNALKYSPHGGKICVSLDKSEHRGILLTISNDGDAISKNELENIFLRFYRCDESRSEYNGFGLGLSIARNIVHEHNGKIWAESDENVGNTFFVSLLRL